MKEGYTHIAMVIDRSGSMNFGWSDVVGGYESTIKQQKEQDGECTFTLAVFDTEYDLIEDFTKIGNVNEKLTVLPRGGTALLDAVGKTINSVGEKLAALSEDERPEKVLVMVQTDGYENSSREFTRESLKALIKQQEDQYNWQFMFLGATLDSVAEAVSFGFSQSNSANYNAHDYTKTMNMVGDKLAAYRSCSSSSASESASWTSSEREELNK